MTAKKKRKKLINYIYHGFLEDPVVPLQLTAPIISPPWATRTSVGFDDCPVPNDGDPGGDVSSLTSATKTALSVDEDGSNFWVCEEQMSHLDQGFIRFMSRLFGDKVAAQVNPFSISPLKT